jgi:hypothetical protein
MTFSPPPIFSIPSISRDNYQIMHFAFDGILEAQMRENSPCFAESAESEEPEGHSIP